MAKISPTSKLDTVPNISDSNLNNNNGSEKREQWNSRMEFLLSCVGLSVGIGNVWRFPYLAYANGGGAFLLPYTILLLLVGKPMYYLELALGQYSGLGPMSIWRCSPVSLGVGAAMVVISAVVAIYYTVIVAYTVYFMVASFAMELPWAKCQEWWGADERCYHRGMNISSFLKESNDTCDFGIQTASEQYWKKHVLQIHESDGLSDIGSLRLELVLCLLFTWVIVFFCLFKGIKSSGKVVYFTATFPFIILLILLIRGVTLDGAMVGVKYFFLPRWDKLLKIATWANAAQQMFYSLSISWGGLIMFGSYNNFRNRVHVDAFIVSSLDFVTSIIAGVVIFSVLGALAVELDRDISTVVKAGQGLAFIAYPEALARLPFPQVWSVLFFFMLFTLGLDSEFATLETVLTAVYDEFPSTRNRKPLVCFVACLICFLLGLPCVTNGGQYVLDIMDTYGGGFTVLLIGTFEMIALAWIYGVSNISDNLQYMLGSRPNIYWKVCWGFFCPVILGFLFIFFCIDFTPPKYECYEYPVWGHGMGWGLLLISVIQVPIFAVGVLIYYWNKGDITDAFRPTSSWGPNDGLDKKSLPVGNSSHYNNGGIDNPGIYIYNLSSL